MHFIAKKILVYLTQGRNLLSRGTGQDARHCGPAQRPPNSTHHTAPWTKQPSSSTMPTPQGPLSFFTARQIPSFTKSHLDLTFTCASTETRGRHCLSLYSQSLTLQAGPEASSCSLLSHPDRHSTASFVNLRLKIPSGANWTSFKKRESTSDLSTMGTATCYLTWSQLPFRFCPGLELQGAPNSMHPALIRFLGLAGEKGPGRKKSVRDALPPVNTSWSYRVNVHGWCFP